MEENRTRKVFMCVIQMKETFKHYFISMGFDEVHICEVNICRFKESLLIYKEQKACDVQTKPIPACSTKIRHFTTDDRNQMTCETGRRKAILSYVLFGRGRK